MLEKCNTHTRWALFDIMLDIWECWKSATLTHFGHFVASCWTFGNAGKVQHSHTFGWGVMLDFWECWKSATLTHFGHFLTSSWMLGMLESATLTHFCPPSTWSQLGLPQLSAKCLALKSIFFLYIFWNAGKVQPSHTHTL